MKEKEFYPMSLYKDAFYACLTDFSVELTLKKLSCQYSTDRILL